MNLQLLNPFEHKDFPEVIDTVLEEGMALTLAFNRKGTLLATGCNDGRCIIYDFDTRGVAKSLMSHVSPVSAVSWSRNGRRLLTAADASVKVWDVLGDDLITEVLMPSKVLSAQMHARDNHACVVCCLGQDPVLIDLKTGKQTPLESPEEGEESGSSKRRKPIDYVAIFDRTGEHVYVGGNKGIVSVFSWKEAKPLYTISLSTKSATARSLSFSRDGKYLLANGSDRSLRVIDVEAKKVTREYQDAVSRLKWKSCCFSGDGDYVIGGSANTEHNIYIWNRAFGDLSKLLEGPPGEGVMALVWHPTRPIIASCSRTGVVYLWAKNYTENWSAFAPDFTELEENEEYVEREDEFDIIPDKKKKQDKVELDEMVDVTTVEKTVGDQSDSDDEELFFLPTIPDPDPPEQASEASAIPADRQPGLFKEVYAKQDQQRRKKAKVGK